MNISNMRSNAFVGPLGLRPMTTGTRSSKWPVPGLWPRGACVKPTSELYRRNAEEKTQIKAGKPIARGRFSDQTPHGETGATDASLAQIRNQKVAVADAAPVQKKTIKKRGFASRYTSGSDNAHSPYVAFAPAGEYGRWGGY